MGDYTLQEMIDVQTGIRLILKLCLADGFDMFPTLLVIDGSCMIDVQTGIRLILKLCLADGFDMFPTLLVIDGSCMIDRRMEDIGNDKDGDEVRKSSNANEVIEVTIGLMGTHCMELAVLDNPCEGDDNGKEIKLDEANGVIDNNISLISGDDVWKEGGKIKEREVIIGDKITCNGSSVSSLCQSIDGLHKNLTSRSEVTLSNGLRPEDEDDSNDASLVLKTPFLEACVKKIQEEKEYGVLGILKEKIDDDAKEDDNRRVAFYSGYGVDGLKKKHSKNGDFNVVIINNLDSQRAVRNNGLINLRRRVLTSLNLGCEVIDNEATTDHLIFDTWKWLKKKRTSLVKENLGVRSMLKLGRTEVMDLGGNQGTIERSTLNLSKVFDSFDNRCEMNKGKLRSLVEEQEICAVKVDKKIEDGKDIESKSLREVGDNNGVMFVDNSSKENGNDKC
ncbi:hypothetical protein CTI12_AA481660 [Artemisia annua]|uniref:Alkaline/neutral invertase n=1 Tax=Artemisia annua TaxID=35608 RepID=A0A2U1LKB8_ARTAN|nr:hypothetical protein CTI12_AA481660 [Artemisia annua]